MNKLRIAMIALTIFCQSVLLCHNAAQNVFYQILDLATAPGNLQSDLDYYKKIADTALEDSGLEITGVTLKKYTKYFKVDEKEVGKSAIKKELIW